MAKIGSDRREILRLGGSFALGSYVALASPALGHTPRNLAARDEAAQTNPPLIDIHPHIASKDTIRYPITPIGGKRSEWSAKRSATIEELLAAMDEAGVIKAALVHSSTTYGFNCAYCADAVALHPKRLTGIFSVDVTAPDASRKMHYWYARGCTGMRIFTRGSTMKQAWLALDDPRIEPCYRTAQDLGISVAVNIKSDQFDQFEAVLNQFSAIRFVLDSLGGTDFTDGTPYAAARPLWKLAQYPNLYLKLVTGNFMRARSGKASPDTLFPRIAAEYGSDRIAWGSDYPSARGALNEMVALARASVRSLSRSDQDNLFSRTALTLYPALAD